MATARVLRPMLRTRLISAPVARSFTTSLPAGAARRPLRSALQRRVYSSETPQKSSSGFLITLAALAVAGGGAYYYYTSELAGPGGQSGKRGPRVGPDSTLPPSVTSTTEYQKVYNAIAEALEGEGADAYDDGSYGPVIVRLAWHASGTYDKETGTGGSNGATMRFAPESDHGANAGLKKARDVLEPIKKQFPWITYSDLWTLAGVVALQEMGGPTIPWRPGRQDKDIAACSPDGRLPDASKGEQHLRDIFYRMGWNDQEIVALSGAHALGRCHTDRSGFTGPWTFSPTMLTNDYYKLLLDEKWQYKKWSGPKQFEDRTTKTLMMLPTDMVLIKDKSFRKWVEVYAKDQNKFFEDFAKVASRLFELGVPFPEASKPMNFKPTQA